jgi:iron complex transport system permease protein
MTRGVTGRLVLLGILAVVAVAGASLLGPRWLSWDELMRFDEHATFWKFRVPRTLLAACAGAGLALGGVIFQGLFRNPLAEPFTLGLAGGASLGAATGYLLHLGGTWLGLPRLGLCALVGTLAALGAVLVVARSRGGRDMTRLLLAGVCVSYLSMAGVLLVMYSAQRTVTDDIVRWMMGSLITVTARPAAEIAVVLAVVAAFALVSHRALDLLAMGDDLAASRGVNVNLIVNTALLLVGVLVAIIVAHCGPIAFVGLMVPHIVRQIVGARTLGQVIGSLAVGAAFLAVCDGCARLGTFELPVGIITNILGAGFFLFLLFTRDTAFDSGR